MITKYEDPWLYYTVDNYFPHDIFESMSESIQSFIKTGYKNLSESQNGILHTSREIMNVIGNNALSSFNRLAKEKAYSLYNIEKKDRNIYNEIKFMEAGGNYPKHDESLNKSKASFYDIIAKYHHKVNKNNVVRSTVYVSNDNFSITSDSLYSYSNKLVSLDWEHRFDKKNSINFLLLFNYIKMTESRKPII